MTESGQSHLLWVNFFGQLRSFQAVEETHTPTHTHTTAQVSLVGHGVDHPSAPVGVVYWEMPIAQLKWVQFNLNFTQLKDRQTERQGDSVCVCVCVRERDRKEKRQRDEGGSVRANIVLSSLKWHKHFRLSPCPASSPLRAIADASGVVCVCVCACLLIV